MTRCRAHSLARSARARARPVRQCWLNMPRNGGAGSRRTTRCRAHSLLARRARAREARVHAARARRATRNGDIFIGENQRYFFAKNSSLVATSIP